MSMVKPRAGLQQSARQPAPGGTSTRRRGPALEAALLDAAWQELQAAGYAKLTMEGVADRAGTSRPVLSRRWRSRPELVIAALRHHRPMLSGETPDTGSLRGDVLALLRRTSAGMTEIGPETIYGLIGDYFADPALFSGLRGDFLQPRAHVMAAILRHAAERGEIRGDISPRIATLPIDLLRHELFLSRTPPQDPVITQIVDEVFLPLVGVRPPPGE
jgi:AcrR family transcriptional regulator